MGLRDWKGPRIGLLQLEGCTGIRDSTEIMARSGRHATDYTNALFIPAQDCPVAIAVAPARSGTIADLHYQRLHCMTHPVLRPAIT